MCDVRCAMCEAGEEHGDRSGDYSLKSSRYRAIPETPTIAAGSRMMAMNAASGIPSHWLTSPCREAGSNPNRG
jgi:hypothetical protein